MSLAELLTKGLPVSEKLILSQAVVDPQSGRLYCGVGWEISDDLQAGAWIKTKPASPALANSLAGIINGVRREIGASDDSPGLLTVAELVQILFGVGLTGGGK